MDNIKLAVSQIDEDIILEYFKGCQASALYPTSNGFNFGKGMITNGQDYTEDDFKIVIDLFSTTYLKSKVSPFIFDNNERFNKNKNITSNVIGDISGLDEKVVVNENKE